MGVARPGNGCPDTEGADADDVKRFVDIDVNWWFRSQFLDAFRFRRDAYGIVDVIEFTGFILDSGDVIRQAVFFCNRDNPVHRRGQIDAVD